MRNHYFSLTILSLLIFSCKIERMPKVSVEYVNLTETSSVPIIHEYKGEEEKTSIVIKVDLNEANTIEGIGGTFNELGWNALEALDDAQRKQVIKSLFSPTEGLGLSYNRIPVGASDFGLDAYSHSELEEDWDMKHFSLERDEKCLIRYIKEAQKINPSMKFHASPWSPPAWLKESKSMIGRDTTNLLLRDERTLPTYAKYLVKFCEGYKDNGITINRLLVQNESGNQTRYPSCRIDAKQMMELITKHLKPMMAQSNSKETEIWAGTFNTGARETSIDDHKVFVEANEFMQNVDGFGFQYAAKKYIDEIRGLYPNLKLMHTESQCYDGTNLPDAAKRDFQDIVIHMRRGFEVFSFWNMILPEPRKSTWGWAQNSLIAIDKDTKEVKYMPSFLVAHLVSQAIRPGTKYLDSEIVQGEEILGALKYPSRQDRWMKMQGEPGEQLITVKKTDGSIVILLMNQGPEVKAEIKLADKSVFAVLPANKLCAINIGK